MPEGRIIKALSGYYYVLDEEAVWQCRARGVFKKKGISPLVGDLVTYDREANGEGYVTAIHERTTQLVRPPVANVDQAVLVFYLVDPPVSTLLLDKFLVHIESAGVRPLICLSKADLTDEVPKHIAGLYESIGYKVFITSKFMQEETARLHSLLSGHISVLSGQSGVGKSTLLNTILPEVNLLTGIVSERLGRGRHTTRHVELLPVEDGFVADTPGFSQLDFFDIEAEELSHFFVEMRRFIPDCKYRGCLHLEEPRCAVKEAVSAGEIPLSRYENYKQFVQEIKEKKRRY